MRAFAFAFLLLEAVLAPTHAHAIVGGAVAAPVPWGAQVYTDEPGRPMDGFACTGTVIAPRWVLTARHCIDPDDGMRVRIGSNGFGAGTEVRVGEKNPLIDSDIALLRLSRPVHTRYAKLADTDPRPGEINKIYGWGREAPDGPPAPRLKVAEVEVVQTEGRTDMFGGRALISEGRTGAAMPGDSGGPQFHDGEQVGVASMLDHDGDDPNGTIVYSSVPAHRDWIRSTAGV
ncbi:S1 family peptidase [Actinomadura welshii]